MSKCLVTKKSHLATMGQRRPGYVLVKIHQIIKNIFQIRNFIIIIQKDVTQFSNVILNSTKIIQGMNTLYLQPYIPFDAPPHEKKTLRYSKWASGALFTLSLCMSLCTFVFSANFWNNSGSLYLSLSLTYSGSPRITWNLTMAYLGNLWPDLTQDEPKVTKVDPRVTQGDPGVTPGWPKATQG